MKGLKDILGRGKTRQAILASSRPTVSVSVSIPRTHRCLISRERGHGISQSVAAGAARGTMRGRGAEDEPQRQERSGRSPSPPLPQAAGTAPATGSTSVPNARPRIKMEDNGRKGDDRSREGRQRCFAEGEGGVRGEGGGTPPPRGPADLPGCCSSQSRWPPPPAAAPR